MSELPYHWSTVLFLFLYCSAAQMECAGCVRMHTHVRTRVRTVRMHRTRVRTHMRTVNTHLHIVHTHSVRTHAYARTYGRAYIYFFQKLRKKIKLMFPSFDFFCTI